MPARFIVQCEYGHLLKLAPNEVVTCPACECVIDAKELLTVVAMPPAQDRHEQ